MMPVGAQANLLSEVVAHVLHEASPLQGVHAHPGDVHWLPCVPVESPPCTRSVYLGAVAAMVRQLGPGWSLAESLHADQRWLERVVDSVFLVSVCLIPPLFSSRAAVFVDGLLGEPAALEAAQGALSTWTTRTATRGRQRTGH